MQCEESVEDANEEEVMDDAKLMAKMGLPSTFSANLSTNRYYCNVCMVHLTSEDAYYAHQEGILHRKTVLNSRQKLTKFGTDKRNPMDYLKLEEDDYEINVLEKENTVVHKRLIERLAETRKGFVGLEMVREINPCSIRDMEPYYDCKLCNYFKGYAPAMLSHVLSPAHSELYLRYKGLWDDIATVEDLVENNKENENLHTIQIVHSDELYPWPPGKAPWCNERGGTGILPSSLQSEATYATDIKRNFDDKEEPLVTFNVRKLPPLKSAKVADAYMEAAMQILDKAVSFHKKFIGKPDDEPILEVSHVSAQASIRLIEHICADGKDVSEEEIQVVN